MEISKLLRKKMWKGGFCWRTRLLAIKNGHCSKKPVWLMPESLYQQNKRSMLRLTHVSTHFLKKSEQSLTQEWRVEAILVSHAWSHSLILWSSPSPLWPRLRFLLRSRDEGKRQRRHSSTEFQQKLWFSYVLVKYIGIV